MDILTDGDLKIPLMKKHCYTLECSKLQIVKTQFSNVDLAKHKRGKSSYIFVSAVNDIPEANQHNAILYSFS